MMRFNHIACLILLTGVSQATPVQEIFIANRADILSRSTTVVGDYVFTVGKAKSSAKAGDQIGYSKASLIAYDNLDRLNYDRAGWGSDVTKDERAAVWKSYRSTRPFTLTIEGGQRVHQEKPQNENFLVVMVFPQERVLLPPVSDSELKPFVDRFRSEKKALEAAVEQELAKHNVTNSNSNKKVVSAVSTKNGDLDKFDPIRGAKITPTADSQDV